MYLTSKKKQEFFKTHGKNEKDTGSPEGQIALFTFRIAHLTEHLKNNKKDYGTQRSLINLVGKRRKLLNYLIKVDIMRYRNIVKELGLRK
jgi:small subunit ribosomal protein S15|tara:strand:+ start:398 stop:667 length:270 start_codon:yes stop_codon:yes gene_type:complete